MGVILGGGPALGRKPENRGGNPIRAIMGVWGSRDGQEKTRVRCNQEYENTLF